MIADIAHWQRIRMAIVGDPHQQLYRFRGAKMPKQRLDGRRRGALPDPELAIRPRDRTRGQHHPLLQGRDTETSGLGPQTLVKSPSRRTFLTALSFTAPLSASSNALQLVRNHPEPKFHWVGGIDSYSLRDLEDLYAFSRGLRQNVQNKTAS